MLAIINAQRTATGLAPLTLDAPLTTIARERVRDMIQNGYFGHYRPDGTLALQELLLRYQVPFAWAGENIARNNYPPAETVTVAFQGFLASPSHRDNLLSPHYDHIGIGVARDQEGMYYYALIFVGRSP